MPRWLNVGLGGVGVVVAIAAVLARAQRLSDGPSFVRAAVFGVVALVVLGAVSLVSRRYGDPET